MPNFLSVAMELVLIGLLRRLMHRASYDPQYMVFSRLPRLLCSKTGSSYNVFLGLNPLFNCASVFVRNPFLESSDTLSTLLKSPYSFLGFLSCSFGFS